MVAHSEGRESWILPEIASCCRLGPTSLEATVGDLL